MAITKKVVEKTIKESDFFAVQVYRDSDEIFLRYYKTYEQAKEAFDRLHSNVEHQLAKSIDIWTTKIYNVWKSKYPDFDKIKHYLEHTWGDKYCLNRPINELYVGDVWNHFNDCLRRRFMFELKQESDVYDYCISKFYAYSLSFNQTNKYLYKFALTGMHFTNDVDEPRRWIKDEGIKMKK